MKTSEILSQIVYLFAIALPVASIAWTVTKEEIFREVREGLERWKDRKPSIFRHKAHYVFTCYYCFSHYPSALFVGALGVKFLTTSPFGYLAAWFSVAFASQFWLTGFNYARAALRGAQANADNHERYGLLLAKKKQQEVVAAQRKTGEFPRLLQTS